MFNIKKAGKVSLLTIGAVLLSFVVGVTANDAPNQKKVKSKGKSKITSSQVVKAGDKVGFAKVVGTKKTTEVTKQLSEAEKLAAEKALVVSAVEATEKDYNQSLEDITNAKIVYDNAKQNYKKVLAERSELAAKLDELETKQCEATNLINARFENLGKVSFDVNSPAYGEYVEAKMHEKRIHEDENLVCLKITTENNEKMQKAQGICNAARESLLKILRKSVENYFAYSIAINKMEAIVDMEASVAEEIDVVTAPDTTTEVKLEECDLSPVVMES